MTTPSHYWKSVLRRQSATLDKLQQPHRWSEASSVRLEEAVVLGFYAIRKLITSFLLSSTLVHRPVRMNAFPARRQDGLGPGDEEIDKLYDLNAGRIVSHDLLFLCHQVTHNCAFHPTFDQAKNLRGLYVTSDHQRKVALYGIDLDQLSALFQQVGDEH